MSCDTAITHVNNAIDLIRFISYTGAICNGVPHGIGRGIRRDDNCIISGTFKNGFLHGHGKRILDGQTDEGTFVNGHFSHGVMSNGGTYWIGTFKKGKLHGMGMYSNFNGSARGMFRNGELFDTTKEKGE